MEAYKVNLQKLFIFLHTSNEKMEFAIQGIVLVTLVSPKIKPSIGLKYVQDLYTENYKTLIKEIKGELNKWRDISCSWIATLLEMSVPDRI